MLKTINTTPALCFDDVLILPADITFVKSRTDVSLKSTLSGVNKDNQLICDYPLMSSPMDTVTGPEMVQALAALKTISYLPRYNTPEEQTILWENSVKGVKDTRYAGSAIGCQEHDFERFEMLYEAGCRNFCIDIANGHMEKLHTFLQQLVKLKDDVFLISGNVATKTGYSYLSEIGISGVRVGIGGGAGCTTRIQTGVGYPTLESLASCQGHRKFQLEEIYQPTRTAVIADGGIRNPGDAAKSLIFSDFIMLGSLLASCEESPGEVVNDENGIPHKLYRGMASLEAQRSRPNADVSKIMTPEGKAGLIPLGKPVEVFVKELFGGVASAMSYTNSFDLKEFSENAKLAYVSQATGQESHPRVK